MIFDLCQACTEKHGPFEKAKQQFQRTSCDNCQKTAVTTSVIGCRVVCSNAARCRGWTPVFPPEKYDKYTEGWHQLRDACGGDKEVAALTPPIWTHCPACRAEQPSKQVLDTILGVQPMKSEEFSEMFDIQDPKSITAAARNFRPKEEIGDAVVNVPAVARVRFGWDANGSPTEDWP